jgi:2-polyprenyl-3-methyl-5-hydroxy-6-metoxy-1,4-benzoquinol methylase
MNNDFMLESGAVAPLVPSPLGHFEAIAADYDAWKARNRYYHDQVMRAAAARIPAGARVVEVGCGTGDVLASLQPSWGLGIDISPAMIGLARSKWAGRATFSFLENREVVTPLDPPPDFILAADVVEHVEDPVAFAAFLGDLAGPRTKVVIQMANLLWEPILLLLEKLGLKMPEGPHHRRSFAAWQRILEAHGFSVSDRRFFCLLPHRLFDPVNRLVEGWPLVSRFAIIETFIAERRA